MPDDGRSQVAEPSLKRQDGREQHGRAGALDHGGQGFFVIQLLVQRVCGLPLTLLFTEGGKPSQQGRDLRRKSLTVSLLQEIPK